MKLIDLTGKKFNKLTVKDRGETKNKKTYWICDCDCGTKDIMVEAYALKNGKTKS